MPSWNRCKAFIPGLLLLLSLLTASSAVAENAPAPRLVILDKVRFLNDHLPGEEGPVTALQPDATLLAQAVKKYHITPRDLTYELVLARGNEAGRPAGGAIFLETPYKEGSLLLGLVLSEELRVLKAALLEVSPPYKETFETTTGTGILTRYTMMSARQLDYLASQLRKQGPAGAVVGNGIHYMGAILAIILEQRGS